MKHIKTALLMLGAMAWQGALAQDTATEQTQAEPLPGFDMPREEKEKSADYAIIANISPGWITSKVFTPSDTYTWQSGLGFEVGCRCLFHSGYGFGISYAHSSTDYPGGYNLGLNYAGASFVYGGHFAQHWIATVEAGIGFAIYSDAGVNTQSGFGSKYAIGIERLIGRSFGLGINIASHMHTFSKDEDNGYYDSDKYINGFQRLSINIGMRLYL